MESLVSEKESQASVFHCPQGQQFPLVVNSNPGVSVETETMMFRTEPLLRWRLEKKCMV